MPDPKLDPSDRAFLDLLNRLEEEGNPPDLIQGFVDELNDILTVVTEDE